MAVNSSSRQLLFGILALQMDFIRREQLIAGASVWLQDKSRKLEEILVEQDALREGDRQLLSPLVDRHIANHDDDAEKSLGAIDLAEPMIRDLQALGDQEIEATLSIASSRSNAQTGGESAPTSSSTDRFRVLRSHAKGGLGEVSLAHDTELNREVAFKEIQSQFADDENSRSRFLLEAEVTARLEHPGVVPVYGLGRYDDGRPFYAMRFIKGDSLKEAADHFHAGQHSSRGAANFGLEETELATPYEGRKPAVEKSEAKPRGIEDQQASRRREDCFQSVEFRKLLARFVDVCDAMAYAHSRGVLHRDLKPGNIMLGKFGETLVVDWGLAKTKGQAEDFRLTGDDTLRPSSGSAVADTAMGSAIGTPAYMPPEQAAGRLDELGPASDVYSLGATLYYLLTGQPPIQGASIAEVLKKVESGQISPPSSVAAGLPKPLNAICLRAMAMQPSQRYATPQELADDIERFLADEPVKAYEDPVSVRLRRWIRKHQTLAASTAAVVLVSALGLGAISIVISGKNAELTRLNKTLDDRNNQLASSNKREKAARVLAEQNAKIARAQSQLALSMLSSTINDVQRGLAKLPAGGAIRRRLLLTSLERLKDVAVEYVPQTNVDEHTFMALNNLGGVVLDFGAGDANALASSSEEDKSAVELASSLFSRARQIAIQLAEQDPQNPIHQRNLAIAHSKFSELELRTGQVADSVRSAQRSVVLFDQLAKAAPDDNQAIQNLCNSLQVLGNAQLRAGLIKEANATFQRGFAAAQELVKVDAKNADWQRYVFVFCDRLGEFHFRALRMKEARAFYQRGLDASRIMVEQTPDDPKAKGDLAFGHLKLGHVWLQSEQPDKALAQYLQAVTINKARVDDDPSNESAQQLLAASHTHVGEAKLALGNASAALPSLQQGLTIRAEAVERDPKDADAKRMLLSSYKSLGDAQWSADKKDASIASYRKAIEIGRELTAMDPDDIRGRTDLATLHSQLGAEYRQLDRFQDAEESYRECLRIRKSLLDANPDDESTRRNHFIALSNLAELQGRSGKPKEALLTLRLCLKAAQDRADANPESPRAQRDLCIAYEKLGVVQIKLGQLAEAAESYENFVKISASRVRAAPASSQAKSDLAVGHYKLAVVHRNLGTFRKAIDSYQRAIDLLQELDAAGKLVTAQKAWISTFKAEQQSAQMALLASGSWEAIESLPKDQQMMVLYHRVSMLVAKDDFPEALKALDHWIALKPTKPNALYDLACGHGVYLAAQVESQANPTAEQKSAHRKRAELAAETVKAAISAGYSDMRHLASDPDLAAVRALVDLSKLTPKQPQENRE